MKKTLVASVSVATLALAAVPAFGAFADVTDTVTITINSSCSIGSTTSTTGGGKNFTDTMTNGSLKTWDATAAAGGSVIVSCNNASGWNIKAIGASTGSSNTAMTPSASGTAIATGIATSGPTSNWAFKVAGTNAVAAYTSFSAVPATATKVAGNNASTSEETIYTGYQVWVSATQAADTYTGKVTYTVATGTT